MSVFWITLIIVVIITIWVGIKDNEEGKGKQEALKYIEFDERTGTLIVKERHESIKNCVTIEDAMHDNLEYVPEKIHVGAVTVGGVTSGGAYKTGGYNHATSVKINGKALLMYNDKTINAGKKIKRIRLEGMLKLEAKQSTLKNYMNNVDEIVVIKEAKHSWMSMTNAQMGDFDYYNRDIEAGYPLREKCEIILNWLTGSEEYAKDRS